MAVQEGSVVIPPLKYRDDIVSNQEITIGKVMILCHGARRQCRYTPFEISVTLLSRKQPPYDAMGLQVIIIII